MTRDEQYKKDLAAAIKRAMVHDAKKTLEVLCKSRKEK